MTDKVQEIMAALELAANRMERASLDFAYGSNRRSELIEWAEEARARLREVVAPPVPEPGEWIGLTDADRQAAFESLPDMLDGFLKTWGWLHFANAIEQKCKEKNRTLALDALRWRKFRTGDALTVKCKKATVMFGPNPERDYPEALDAAIDRAILTHPPEATHTQAASSHDDYDISPYFGQSAQPASEPVAWQVSASFWRSFDAIPTVLQAAAIPLYATPQPASEPDLHDFKTHRAPWRKAIEHLAKQDDSGYWKHELQAFDKAMAEFDRATPQPAASPTQPRPLTEGDAS